MRIGAEEDAQDIFSVLHGSFGTIPTNQK